MRMLFLEPAAATAQPSPSPVEALALTLLPAQTSHPRSLPETAAETADTLYVAPGTLSRTALLPTSPPPLVSSVPPISSLPPRRPRPPRKRKFRRRHPAGLRLTGELGRKLQQAVAEARAMQQTERGNYTLSPRHGRFYGARSRRRSAGGMADIRSGPVETQNLVHLPAASAKTILPLRQYEMSENVRLPASQALPPLLPDTSPGQTSSPPPAPRDRNIQLPPIFPMLPPVYRQPAEKPMAGGLSDEPICSFHARSEDPFLGSDLTLQESGLLLGVAASPRMTLDALYSPVDSETSDFEGDVLFPDLFCDAQTEWKWSSEEQQERK
ncbi:hypothetical protein BROUX41_002876 [Berkeleyomyces rouxiae]